jgi:hypothetical protein
MLQCRFVADLIAKLTIEVAMMERWPWHGTNSSHGFGVLLEPTALSMLQESRPVIFIDRKTDMVNRKV